MANKITAIIDIVTKDAQKSLKNLKQDISNADGAVGKFKLGVKGGFEAIKKNIGTFSLASAGALLAFGDDVLNAGVAMEAMDAKAETVFGDGIGRMRAWAEESAGALGLTERKAIDAGASIQDLLVPMGFARDEAQGMTLKLLDVAGALSAWSGGKKSVEEVSASLTKALLGEREELKSLGISITEADVKTRLAAKGQQDLTGAALAQAKAIATQELIFEKSTDAQKAWSDGSMDATKRANEGKASFAELGETLNETLAPALAKAMPLIVEAAEGLGWMADKLVDLADFVGVAEDMERASKAADTLLSEIESAGSAGARLMALAEAGRETHDSMSNVGKAVQGLAGFLPELADQGAGAEYRFDAMAKAFRSLAAESPVAARQLVNDLGAVMTAAEGGSEVAKEYAASVDLSWEKIDELVDALPPLASNVADVAAEMTAGTKAVDTYKTGTSRYASVAKDAERSTRQLDAALSALNGELDQEQAVLDYEQAMEDLVGTMLDGEASARDQAQAMIDGKRAALDYVTSLGTIPADKKTAIVTAISEGDFQLVKKLLDELTRDRTVTVTTKNATGGGGGPKTGVGYRADGGPIKSGQPYIVGEEGPELIIPQGNGMVIPNDDLRNRSGRNMVWQRSKGRRGDGDDDDDDDGIAGNLAKHREKVGLDGGDARQTTQTASGDTVVYITINSATADGPALLNTLRSEARRRGLTIFG